MDWDEICDIVLDEAEALSSEYRLFDLPEFELRIGEEQDFDDHTYARIFSDYSDTESTYVIEFPPRAVEGTGYSERAVRETGRHEVAHGFQIEAHKGVFDSLSYQGGSELGIRNAPLEAFAFYEEGLIDSRRDNAYRPFKMGNMPDIWHNEVVGDHPTEPDDPHKYGKLAAQLIEMSYMKDKDLEDAQRATRDDLLNSMSFDEGVHSLENKVREACNRLEVPYYRDIVREQREEIRDRMKNGVVFEVSGGYWDAPPKSAIESIFKSSKADIDEAPDFENYCRAKAQLYLAESEFEDNRWYRDLMASTGDVKNAQQYLDPADAVINPGLA